MKCLFQFIDFATLPLLCTISFAVRAFLIFFSQWYDSFSMVPFTDVDYFVFHDAAQFVHQNLSPYLRETYRYTPLISFLLLVNQYFNTLIAGKLVFAIFDIFTGIVLYRLQLLLHISSSDAKKYTLLFWLFNPFVIAITCRGNAESVIAFSIVLFCYFLQARRLFLASLFYGLSVHLKIFPILFILPIYFYFLKKGSKTNWIPLDFFLFSLISGSVFLFLFGLFYWKYGYVFFYECYLYHLIRKDHRHNMSIYFYYFYLLPHVSFYDGFLGKFAHLILFIPQFILVIVIGWAFSSELLFSFFLETFAFVTFNKVCTSQYFVWYILLAPLIIHKIYIPVKKILALLASWTLTQGLWLYFAYRLEFCGDNVYFAIFLCSCLFFITNIWILSSLIDGFIAKKSIKDK